MYNRRISLFILLVLLLTGCTETRNPYSNKHPFTPRRPYQEMDINLSRYKSPQLRTHQNKHMSVILSLSGGGERAAAFATGVFIGLENLKHQHHPDLNAMQEVDYFSTVSGGGMAAGVYLSKLYDYHLALKQSGKSKTISQFNFENEVYQNTVSHIPFFETKTGVRAALSHSYVDDLLEGLFSIFSSSTIDRGDFLEKSFDDNLLDYKTRQHSIRLEDIFIETKSTKSIKLPILVANATIFENGHILPFIPSQLAEYQISGYMHRLKKHSRDPDQYSYHRFASRLPLSLALKASGTFPVAIPATTLKADYDKEYNPYIHLLDGGIADNLGVMTGFRLFAAETYPQVNHRVMIVVDAFKDTFSPFSQWEQAPSEAKTAIKVAGVGIDSWRGRSREIVSAMAKSNQYGNNIKTVFLSFDDIRTTISFQDLTKFGLTIDDMHKLGVTRHNKKLIHGKEPTPYLLARSIRTTYRMSEHEFNFLVALGRIVVFQQQDAILNAYRWPNLQSPDKE